GRHDFVSTPRLSPDGRHLAWLAWNHPNMPWIGTTLHLAELGPDGTPRREPIIVAGGENESIVHPTWSPDGAALVFVSDRSGWWNLYRHDLASGSTQPLAPMSAEFGQPQWAFGLSTYAFVAPDRIVAAYTRDGLAKLAVLDIGAGALTDLDLPFTEYGCV